MQEANFRVYPNPFSDQIIFELDKNYSKIKLEIADIFGRQIIQSNSNTHQVILTDEELLTSRTYFFRLVDSNNQILKTGKIIKL